MVIIYKDKQVEMNGKVELAGNQHKQAVDMKAAERELFATTQKLDQLNRARVTINDQKLPALEQAVKALGEYLDPERIDPELRVSNDAFEQIKARLKGMYEAQDRSSDELFNNCLDDLECAMELLQDYDLETIRRLARHVAQAFEPVKASLHDWRDA